jgi:NADPH2:quinone reductase
VRAVWLKEFGGPEVLVPSDTPDPEVLPDQVLVEVEFANITFVETQVRAGKAPWPVQLPMIPGNGVGGVVVSVGASVDPSLVGARVITSTGGTGGYASLAAVDSSGLIAVPADVALDHAVALLADGRTATMLADSVGLRAGNRVLLEAAAGGVGTLLVQLARAAGALVVALAGGPHKVALVRGADVVIDYLLPDWPDRVRAAVGVVDVVFDGVGGEIGRDAFSLLDPGGRMLSFGLASGEWAGITPEAAAARGVSLLTGGRPTPAEARSYTLRALSGLVPVIGRRFPLSWAADAHALIESRGAVGKTLLEVR